MAPFIPHQNPDGGWTVCPVFLNPEYGAEYAATLEKLDADSDAPGFSDVGIRNLLFTHIVNLRPKAVLEIGSHIGTASVVMGQALKMNRSGHLYTLEPQEHYFKKATQYVAEAQVQEYVSVIQGMSSDETLRSKLASLAPFQVMFVDANHNYASVMEEIKSYWPLLAPNGCIFFHDTSVRAQELDTEKQGAVRRAIIEAAQLFPDFKLISYEYPLWLNPCGAAVACKQNIAGAKTGWVHSLTQRVFAKAAGARAANS